MSLRGRSHLGAVLVCGGILLVVAATVVGWEPNAPSASSVSRAFLWSGLGAVAVGAVVLGLAVRDMIREIGRSRERYDALLRSEAGQKKGPQEDNNR